MDVAHAWIQAKGRDTMTFIAYSCEHNEPVVGRLAVNSLLLTVDPVEQRLVPMESIPLQPWQKRDRAPIQDPRINSDHWTGMKFGLFHSVQLPDPSQQERYYR